MKRIIFGGGEMSKIVSYQCDITKCQKSLTEKEVYDVQVIFHTERTEGYPSDPYLTNQKLYLCSECKKRMLNGNYIHATGAQGSNDFFFKNEAKS